MTRELHADIELLGRIAWALEHVEQALPSEFKPTVRTGLADALSAHDFVAARALIDRGRRRARELDGDDAGGPLTEFLDLEETELAKLQQLRQERLEQCVDELDGWESTAHPDPMQVAEVRARIAEHLVLRGARSEAADWFRSASECVTSVDPDWSERLRGRAEAEASWVPYVREMHRIAVYRVPRQGFEPDAAPGIDRLLGPDSRA